MNIYKICTILVKRSNCQNDGVVGLETHNVGSSPLECTALHFASLKKGDSMEGQKTEVGSTWYIRRGREKGKFERVIHQ